MVGLLLVLAVAYGGETWIEAIKARNAITFQPFLLLWVTALVTLLVGAVMLWVFWAVVTRTPRPNWTGILYLIVGLFVVFSTILYYTQALHWPAPFPPALIPGSLFYFSGGLVGMAGLFMLVLPRPKVEPSE
jgi:uncharacterized membrane protein YuzA (DUF378 family)